jgi:hypothetical protein
MISRSLGVVLLERFLAVERYRDQQASSTHPYRTVESGGCAPAAAPARPVSLILGLPRRLLGWARGTGSPAVAVLAVFASHRMGSTADVRSQGSPRCCRPMRGRRRRPVAFEEGTTYAR